MKQKMCVPNCLTVVLKSVNRKHVNIKSGLLIDLDTSYNAKMEQESAFAAYKRAAENGVGKNKSPTEPKRKKAKKNAASAPSKAAPEAPKSTLNSQKKPQPISKKKQPNSSMVVSSTSGTSVERGNKRKTPSTSRVVVSTSQTGSSSISQNPNPLNDSSIVLGQKAFAHIISDVQTDDFMTRYWEKKPLHITHDDADRYKDLGVSTESIDKMLRTNQIEYTKNIDITSYRNGERETHNPDGRALPGTVWEFYKNGCSIRLLNPQTFIKPLHKFNASLQEYFHCLVGANVYLTPPNSQGFAPHYDDIEAFVLQIEGQKKWHLYAPRSDAETLPRVSSENFSQDEIGQRCWTGILNPGDLLYFPRGWIHQAETVPDHHSLHITLSVYQKTAYADLFEELTKQTVKKAIESDIEFRRGLPIHIWNHFGETYSEFDGVQDTPRQQMKNMLTNMFKSLINHLDFDAAVDNLATKYQHDALPPVLTALEKERTTFGTKPLKRDNGTIEMPEMDEDTEVRLLRAHICRLINTEDGYKLYFHGDNSKEYHGADLNFIEVEDATVEVVKMLIRVYPAYVKISNLSQDIETAMTVVYGLWDQGLVMTRAPIEYNQNNESDN